MFNLVIGIFTLVSLKNYICNLSSICTNVAILLVLNPPTNHYMVEFTNVGSFRQVGCKRALHKRVMIKKNATRAFKGFIGLISASFTGDHLAISLTYILIIGC